MYVTCENPFGNWQRSIITRDAVIKGATEHEIRNCDRTIPMNYRQPDELWPTSTGDDNALMISAVPCKLSRSQKSPGKFRDARRGGEGEREIEGARTKHAGLDHEVF